MVSQGRMPNASLKCLNIPDEQHFFFFLRKWINHKFIGKKKEPRTKKTTTIIEKRNKGKSLEVWSLRKNENNKHMNRNKIE